MSFLQASLLFTLPLAALPVIIHLIHQHQHRTVKWAAMMFLLDARRMQQGVAKLKQILILAMRVLAVAGIIFAVSRPLASGWFGVAVGGGADLTLVLLDRSASMESMNQSTGETKRETALRKVVELLDKTRTQTRLVLIDSARMEPLDVSRPGALLELPQAGATATHADIPALLQKGLDFLAANRAGQVEIWLCSDLRESDWDPRGGRWEALRAAAKGLEGMKINLLSYPENEAENISVQVTGVERRARGEDAELLLDIVLHRTGGGGRAVTVPLGVVVNGVRTQLSVELTGSEHKILGQAIPLSRETARGWGRVELAEDGNRMDNEAYFVFSEPVAHRSVVVSEEEAISRPLLAALRSGPDKARGYVAERLEPARALELNWEGVALVIWQAPLPEADSVVARQLQQFVDEGRSVIFFPPRREGGGELFGQHWGDWKESKEARGWQVQWWRADSDLLANTQSGRALPVGELAVRRARSLQGENNLLARVDEVTPVLTRVPANQGSVYFCNILPQEGESSLAHDGVTFYVMLHRALAQGAASLAAARMVPVGPDALGRGEWRKVAPTSAGLKTEETFVSAVFERGDQWRALVRPGEEDLPGTATDADVKKLLEGVDVQLIRDEAGGRSSLASEIWRAFLVLMGLALVVEAILCLPEPAGTPRRFAPEMKRTP